MHYFSIKFPSIKYQKSSARRFSFDFGDLKLRDLAKLCILN